MERSKPESKQDSAGGEQLHLKLKNAVETSALWTCRWQARSPFSFPLCSANMESESTVERDSETTHDETTEEDEGVEKSLRLAEGVAEAYASAL